MPFVLEWIILATMQHKFVNFHHTVKPVAHILIFLGFLCNIVLAFATPGKIAKTAS